MTNPNNNVITIPAKEKIYPIKVAAYCRVSSDSDEQIRSLASQIKYYTEYINANPDWILAGVYSECISGTDFSKRSEFKRMLKDAKAGKIDLILTKAVSRFGRNILPFLQSISELSYHGVTVQFDAEGFDTSDPDRYADTAICAAVSQVESEHRSRDIKWGIRRGFENGKVHLNHSQFLGYTKDNDGNLIIVEEEAKIVRLIFNLYLQGSGCRKIKKFLEEQGVKTVTGKTEWSTATIDRMLSNEKYAGMALLQKTYVADPLTHKQSKNSGEVSQYFVENSHEAIISVEIFEAVQMRKGLKTPQ